jgi:hypothetical protein
MNLTEIVGYAGSVLVAVSLMMRSVRRLRWINMWGALALAVYGLMLSAYPVFALNAFIVAVNLVYLWKMSRQRDYFSLLPVKPGQDELLAEFLRFYRADIAKFFPSFDLNKLGAVSAVFVMRNMLPVGLFVFETYPPGTATIHLDYVTAEYRDHKNAHYLFVANAEEWRTREIRQFVAKGEVEAHRSYLKRIGFRPDPTDPLLWRKAV